MTPASTSKNEAPSFYRALHHSFSPSKGSVSQKTPFGIRVRLATGEHNADRFAGGLSVTRSKPQEAIEPRWDMQQ